MKKSLIFLISVTAVVLVIEGPLFSLNQSFEQRVAEANSALSIDHVPQELVLSLQDSNKETLKKVLVNLKQDYDLEQIEDLGSPDHDTFTLTFAPDQDLAFVMASETGDFRLEPNYFVQAAALPTDTHYTSEQWYLKNTGQSYHANATATTQGTVGIDTNWQPVFENSNLRGNGITVAVIDSGINSSHPDLQSNLWINPFESIDSVDNDGNGLVDDINGWNFIDEDNQLSDGLGHGTNASGLIAAVANTKGIIGIASQSKVMTLKVLNSVGNGSTSDVVQAINYAVAKGAKVISMSFGGAGASTTAVTQACANAVTQGVVLVAAAGNNNQDIDGSNFGPANLPTVIAVGSIDSQGNKASFSNTGNKLELVAPGLFLLSTRAGSNNEAAQDLLADGSVLPDGYIIRSGTSFSTPMVAAAAALIFEQNPNFTVNDVRIRLQQTARDLGLAGKDTQFGYGLINIASALNIPTVVNQPPQIVTTAFSSNPIQNNGISSTVLTVTASDPNSLSDISSVTANLTSLGQGTMTLTSQGNGTFTSPAITTTVSAGTYSIGVTVTDSQNQTANTTVLLQVIEIPAQINIVSPTPDSTFQTSENPVTLTGTTSGPITKIIVNDTIVGNYILGNTTWSQTISIPDGTTVYNINAYNSGNQLLASDSIIITKTASTIAPTPIPTTNTTSSKKKSQKRRRSSSTVIEQVVIDFVDVPVGHFAYSQVQDLAMKGAVQGYSTTAGIYFFPNNAITRGEFLKIAMRDAGLTQDSCASTSIHFTDTASSPFQDDIACAVAYNVIADGYGNFYPNTALTRAEAVIWLVRIHRLGLVSGNSFPDIRDPITASYIETARANGWLSGQNGLFYPFNNLTRAEATKLIVNSRL